MDDLDDGENERMQLIKKGIQDDTLNKKCEVDDNLALTIKKDVSVQEAFNIMFGFGLGTGVLHTAFNIQQLGFVAWFLCFVGICFVMTVCACLLWLSTQRMMEECDEIDTTRDALPALANFSCGPIFRLIAVAFLIAAALSMGISFMLLSASILSDLLPIGTYSDENLIRIWVVILIVIITPIMYLGTYSDVKLPALIAMVTALLSATCVLINCALYKYYFKGELPAADKGIAKQNFFVAIGTIIFFCTSASYTITNITVIALQPEKQYKSIFSVNVCQFVALLILGVVPYHIFGEHNLPSVISTFYLVINSKVGVVAAFQVLTKVIQVLMLVHLLMATVLDMNPCFLYLEDFLNVKHEFNLKRVIIRTVCMLVILAICIFIPQFEMAISIAGGVPIAFLVLFLPVVIYTKLFELSIYKKILVFFYLLAVVVFILGNLLFSILELC